MNLPEELLYSDEHEWVRLNRNEATVGITDFAQSELGEIVFVELPKVGDIVEFGEPFGSVESVKTVSELYSPLSGKVIKVNEELEGTPEHVNESPYDQGWMIVIELSDADEVNKLWDAKKYKETYSE